MINQAQLTPEQQRFVESEMQPGESPVWLGQPIPRRFAWSCLPTVLFGIPWTGFAIFWVTMAFLGARQVKGDDAMATGFKWFFPLFGVPFVLIGCGFLSSPFWAMRKARRTIYVITQRRAIVFKGGWQSGVRCYGPDELQAIERRQRADGSGDIILSRIAWPDSAGDHHGMMAGYLRRSEAGFLAIADVKQVEALLRALASKADDDEDAPPKLGSAGT